MGNFLECFCHPFQFSPKSKEIDVMYPRAYDQSNQNDISDIEVQLDHGGIFYDMYDGVHMRNRLYGWD